MTMATHPAIEPVFPAYPPTLPNVIREAVRRHGEREFLVDGDRTLSFAETERQSADLALGFLAAGLGKGTRVGLWMRTGADWVTTWWAVGRIGGFAVPFSTLFQTAEIVWALREADIDTLVVDAALAERLERSLPALAAQRSTRLELAELPFLRRIVVFGGADRTWATKAPEGLAALAAERPALDRAFLARVEERIVPADALIGVCTSGSTSTPKIVVHTHGSMLRYTHAYHAAGMGLEPHDRLLCGMPFFWIGGLNGGLMAATFAGACLVMLRGTRPDEMLDVIETRRVTRIRIWPTQFKSLNDRALALGRDLTPLMNFVAPRGPDGELIPPERRIVSLLGMTECFGPHGFGRPTEVLPEAHGGSWGRDVAGLERKIVDPLTGQTLPAGEKGELCIRGFALMQSYYGRERDEVVDRDGWFHTGDICRIDAAGHLYFHGRETEMIKTAGANVSPQEVEGLIAGFGEVAEAIVLGLPDAERGEAVVAVVVPRVGHAVDVEALQRRMKAQISSYKVPRRIVLMSADAIPRTSTGKVRKAALREELLRRPLDA